MSAVLDWAVTRASPKQIRFVVNSVKIGISVLGKCSWIQECWVVHRCCHCRYSLRQVERSVEHYFDRSPLNEIGRSSVKEGILFL